MTGLSIRRSGRLRAAAGGLAVVAVLAGLFFLWPMLFERVEVEEPRDVSAAAATQPYLALERLLTRFGLPTRSATSLGGLPPHSEILWWLAPTRRIAPERLLRWVEEGGHLIVAAPEVYDSVLDQVGISPFDAEASDGDDHLSPQEFQVDRPPWPKFFLSQEDVEVVAAEGEIDAAWNMTVRHGDGLVTAVNDHAFLTNPELARQDHALLVWYLVRADEDRTGVTLVTRDPKPSVWLVLGRRAMPVAVSLAVLALVGLWAVLRRVGPIRPSPSRDRRHLAEHLRASGDFLWRVRCEDALLRAERAALADSLVRRGAAPGSKGGLRGKKLLHEATKAAERAGIEAAAVARALKVREVRDRDRFVDVVRTLEALRRHRDDAPSSSR